MATPAELLVAPIEHPDNGSLLPFPSEAEAIAYIRRRIAPFCKKLTPEASIGNGLRPDLVARFFGQEQFPLAIEAKQFEVGKIVPFPEAIRQAASYAKQLETAAFIAPLAGKGRTKFEWAYSPIGAGLLVAGQFGVGGLYFAHERYGDDPVGGLLLAGQQVATFAIRGGVPDVQWHSNAAHLLRYKNGHGSQSWR
jgi:hypothetical protein